MKGMEQRALAGLAALSVAAVLSACVAPGYYDQPGGYQGGYQGGYPGNPGYAQFGRVANVEYIRGSSSSGVAGTVVGGAVGGLAGHQVGRGSGRTAATIIGAVGGALIGNALERNMSRGGRDYYRVTVQFDNGAVRTFDYAQPPDVQIGDRVRAEGDQLYR